MDIKTFLKNLPAFEDFNAQQHAVLASHLTVGEYQDGHVFIRQGMIGDALYLVMQGGVRIVRHHEATGPDGERRDDEREVGDGEIFGILSLVDNLPAYATSTAKGTVLAAAFRRDAFQKLFHEASPIGRHVQYMIAVQMARDLQETNRRLRAGLTLS
jgi:CRP-like cAMP-binding protein